MWFDLWGPKMVAAAAAEAAAVVVVVDGTGALCLTAWSLPPSQPLR